MKLLLVILMIDSLKRQKQDLSNELQEFAEGAKELAETLGLEPRDVKYWVVDNDEMNELISYGGFQERYPHWRWGMKFDKQQKKSQYLGGKAFEIVNNDDPCHAFLQMSNSISDQKAVIVHVEAHSDFFENNQWFSDNPNASSMLAKNSEKIEKIMEDPEIERSKVESWIDNILCLEDNIDQYSDFIWRNGFTEEEREETSNENPLKSLNLSDDVEKAVIDDEQNEKIARVKQFDDKESDILKYLIGNGQQYDENIDSAVEYEDWQVEVLDILREECYYFAPQKMTKVMNEGWASINESMMMMEESFAEKDEIIDYADQHSKVLNSPGLNPYQLGKALWEHIENTVNRREVVDKLLRIDGIKPDNFHKEIDFQEVHDTLDKRDSDDVIVRNYSLTRIENQGFIQEISNEDLRKQYRYIVDDDKYSTISQAVNSVDYHRGWDRMLEVRETHNDVMFIDEFLTQDFVDKHEFFTYEYRVSSQQNEVASKDVEDVKKKLLLNFTNFGKPTIVAADDNYNNSGELLLIHKYNGIVLNLEKAKEVLKRLFDMWGRPVNLATVGKTVEEREMDYSLSEGVEPEPDEKPIVIGYDGDKYYEQEASVEVEKELQSEMGYSTKPDEWFEE